MQQSMKSKQYISMSIAENMKVPLTSYWILKMHDSPTGNMPKIASKQYVINLKLKHHSII